MALDQNFLLTGPTAVRLYESVQDLPVIDWHNHLPVKDLAEDRQYADLTGLPRVILYTLNPADHAAFAVLSGAFPGDGERGKVTLGPAWWYCDHILGMRDCFENIAAYGVLSVFPGMTADSRSLLSFVRHEYFRRVFCALLAEKAARDEMPSDFSILKDVAEKVCYYNAKAIIKS